MAKYPTRRRIFNLVGEGRTNDDGSARQDILARARPGAPVTLEREPSNPFDPNAVFVRLNREGIGYLKREDAAEVAPALDEGRICSATIHELTGGIPDYPSFGCRICITWEGQTPKEPLPLRPVQSLYENGRGGGCVGTLAIAVGICAAIVTTAGPLFETL